MVGGSFGEQIAEHYQGWYNVIHPR